MKGPYKLTSDEVGKQVTKTSAGNYALGKVNSESIFIVNYVGRSDDDVKARIEDHVGEKYSKFKFSYADSAKSAFLKECRNYHDFGEKEKLNNKVHPDRTKGKDWQCPKCKIFD